MRSGGPGWGFSWNVVFLFVCFLVEVSTLMYIDESTLEVSVDEEEIPGLSLSILQNLKLAKYGK